jgi:DNA polymerase IV (archaeal DinB-like DNA polymerase)
MTWEEKTVSDDLMRIIVHVDMDAFYAAVEERYNPALRGVPVVVGADPKEGRGRGVVTTANYKARKFGIHSALPISRAWRLAQAARKRGEPETAFIRSNFQLYETVSGRIMQIFERSADAVEEASIDEAYLDVSSLDTFDAALERMTALKTEILEKEELGCSVGIGPNKLIAKIASGQNKPDGLTVVTQEQVREFMDPLSIRVIPGIGAKSEAFLHQQNIRRVRELREVPEATLTQWFGSWGLGLFEKAQGLDNSPVSNEWTRKSIGEQETFEQDSRELALVSEQLYRMAERVIAKLRRNEFSGFRTMSLTVRFSDFDTRNRSRTVKSGILLDNNGDALQLVKKEALELLLPFFDARENPRGKAIRLIGLRLEKLF